MQQKQIHVTIVTGFLGAGKTTLLNNVIAKYTGKRFAIIENEFGEIGIDADLIVKADSSSIFELSNGCICCSLSDDFYETLSRLFESGRQFDHLLVETTGIADPNGVVGAFMGSEGLQKTFAIDSVICLADAQNIDNVMDTQPEVNKQLALADIVLLNKVDGLSPERVDELTNLIHVINPMAAIYPTCHADITAIDLLDTFAYKGRHVEQSTLSFTNVVFRPAMTQAAASKLRHSVRSEGFSIPGSFDSDAFCGWIEDYLYYNSKTIFRCKGILSFADNDVKYIFQAVGGQYLIESGGKWQPGEQRFSKLVLIGRDINRSLVEETLFSFVH